ncbi:MAG TPA: type II toxin-antitoxin system death-on-curing family toxin [Candidatus Acidoferrum sp.]|nr:type II toxin-antitoxin system death-on-curing family toxin [Candidatus Acidoferrum sp.]
MKEPRWIDRRAMLHLHSASLAEHGGLAGIRDETLLDSALHRPRDRFAYESKADVFAVAAAYGFGLAKNHAFHDGNKRVAFLAIGLFLSLNGYRLVCDQLDAIRTIMSLAAGNLEEDPLAACIREHAVARAD